MAGVISTAPYKNWQEWLDSEESKKSDGQLNDNNKLLCIRC